MPHRSILHFIRYKAGLSWGLLAQCALWNSLCQKVKINNTDAQSSSVQDASFQPSRFQRMAAQFQPKPIAADGPARLLTGAAQSRRPAISWRPRSLRTRFFCAFVALSGLAGCSLDEEVDVRSEVDDWVRLGETQYFFSRINCTAALFEVKATRITSLVKKVSHVDAGIRAISEQKPVAFEVAQMSPTQVTETIMERNFPMGIGVLSAGTAGKDCMAKEMEEAYFNAILDPTSVMIYNPKDRFMTIFDRRNMRLFYSRGRSE